MPVTGPRRRVRRDKTPELTTDILLNHILPRLPAKSATGLMTVSKEFHSFLKTHQFAKMHLRHVTNDHRHKFLVLSNDTGRWLFSSIDCETPTTATPDDGCLIIPPPSRPVPFLTSCPPYMRVLTSFHGLVCVGIHNPPSLEYSDLILWNPATGDYKILSKANVVVRSYDRLGLYYSCGDDDYKLLHFRQCEVYMYSLRLDSWRKLVVGLEGHLMSSQSVWLNDNLYFLGGLFKFVIMRFNTITENIEVMRLPPCFGRAEFVFKAVCGSLFVHEGYIHLCVRFEGDGGNVKYDTWRMNNGDGDWSMVDTYNMDKIPLARRLKRRPHLMRNGEWLMIHPNSHRGGIDRILYMFDPEKKAYTYTRLHTSMIIPEEGRYTETLVSPNQYVLA